MFTKFFYNLKPHVGDVFKDKNPFSDVLYKIVEVKGFWIRYVSGCKTEYWYCRITQTWLCFLLGKKRTTTESWKERKYDE